MPRTHTIIEGNHSPQLPSRRAHQISAGTWFYGRYRAPYEPKRAGSLADRQLYLMTGGSASNPSRVIVNMSSGGEGCADYHQRSLVERKRIWFDDYEEVPNVRVVVGG